MPIKPFLLFPAFRHGKDTPWGGDELHRLYGKKTDDPRTGESLEMSVIPGLNSVDVQGTPLSDLIAQYGEKLVGTAVRGDFPLLLKLIDAREQLSVQVHPDDHCRRELLLDTDYFRLERLRECKAVPFVAAKTQFSVLTSLSEGILRLADEEISLTPGQTVFIPADCAAFDLTCHADGCF